MKVEKYLFFMSPAVRRVSKRMGIPPPSHHQLCVLYILKRRGLLRFTAISQLLGSYGLSPSERTLTLSLRSLLSSDLIVKSSEGYIVSNTGREFISYVRSFLLNKRIY